MKEVIDKKLDPIDFLTESVAELSVALQVQNDVILCLLHKFDVDSDLPVWTTKKGIEDEVGPKVQACIKAVREVYGRSKADKD